MKEKILVLEDEIGIRSFVSINLKREGYEIIEAGTGAEAIEKINENQIRCTLTKEDLADRDIKISELAYGSGKTRELFQDMMKQANDDFGFDVGDIPLMVEAIPVSPESIILVITKVENPEETEEHLSKFFSKEFKDSFLSHLDDL